VLTGRIRSARWAAAAALLLCLTSPTLGQPEQAEAARQIRYFERGWGFDDVDIGKLTGRLERIGLELPIDLAGRISGRLTVGVPWGALRDARAWRFGGTLTSPRFTINYFVLRGVIVRLQYRDGALRLEQLRVGVPSPDAAPPDDGVLSGTARMELIPRGQLTATTNATNLPLAVILRTLAAIQPAKGRLSGTLTAEVDVDRLRDLAAWSVTGPVNVEELSLRESRTARGSVQMALNGGVLTAHELTVNIGSTTLTGEGRLSLLENQPWSVDAAVVDDNLLALLELIDEFLEGDELQAVDQHITRGGFRGSARLEGDLKPLTANIAGSAELNNLGLRTPAELAERAPLKPLTIDRLALNYALQNDRLELSEIDVSFAGGQITGSAGLPLGAGNILAALRWSGLRVTSVLNQPFRGEGVSDGRISFAFPMDAAADLARWALELNVTLSELGYGPWTLSGVRSGDVALKEGRLTIPQFAGRLNGEPLALSLDMLLQEPWSIEAGFNLPRLQLAWLRGVPQLADYADRLAGTISLTGQLAGAWKPLNLRSSGSVSGESVSFDGRTIDAVRFDYEITPESATLTNLQAQLYGGSLNGEATIAIGEQPGGSATLSWTDIEAAAASGNLLAPHATFAGPTSGRLTLNIPAGALTQRQQWSGSAMVELTTVNVYAWELRRIKPIALELSQGQLKAPNIRAEVDGQPAHAQATLGVNAPWDVAVQSEFTQVRLQRITAIPQLASLAGRVDGQADLMINLQGTLDPLNLSYNGTVAAEGLTFDNYVIDRVRFAYDGRPDSLALTGIDASLYEGRLTGDMTIPIAETAAGSAAVQWTGINIGPLLGNVVELPANVRGHAEGNAAITMPVGDWNRWVDWEVDAKVRLPDLAVDGAPVASIDAAVNQHDQRLTYNASGRLLDGLLRLEGAREPGQLPPAGSVLAQLGSAQLTVRGGSLARLAEVAVDPATLPGPVEGAFDVDFVSTASAEDWSWRSSLRVANVSVGGADITTGLQATASGSDKVLRLEDLSGQLAGGQLHGSGQWRLGARQARIFRIGVRNAQLQGLMALAVDPDDSPLTGPVDIELRVHPGEVWRVSGAAFTALGELGGVPLRNARVPIDLDWHPVSGRMHLVLGGTQITLATGRITGRLVAERSTGWMIDGKYKFYRVDVAALTRELGSESQYGAGRLTGTLAISGRHVRSINDVRARLVADLEDTQTKNIPVLDQIRNYVPGAAVAASNRFNEGRLEARLDRGVIFVEQLSLVSEQLQLYITGRINLNGRLNLDAIVSTGEFGNPVIANALFSRFIELTVVPVGLLASANEYLSNRVIHLSIGGTISRPVIRVRPFESLRAEVVRFFLQQATGRTVGAILPAAAAPAAAAPAVDSRR